MTADAPLVRVERVSKRFDVRRGLFRRDSMIAVANVNLEIARGETIALVGASGSGKSTLGRMLVRLEKPTSGSIWLAGEDIGKMAGWRLREYRRRVAIVFQNPYRSLNPRMSIGRAMAEPLKIWNVVPKTAIASEIARLLESVGLPAAYADRYPHELSGGERQRVAIARALSVRPEFMVADEAVSSLDVSAAAEILNLMLRLRRDAGLTCLFVTHDLSVAAVIADRIVCMQNGEIVEVGSPTEIFAAPKHEYTKLLLDAQLTVNPRPADAASRGRVASPAR